MKFLTWRRGRQEGSYFRLSLLPKCISNFLRCDAYILKFPRGCSVMKHTDSVSKGFRHYRLNITLTGLNPKEKMYVIGPEKIWWRFELFRPDLYEHGLRPITKSMYMLSFGIRLKDYRVV